MARWLAAVVTWVVVAQPAYAQPDDVGEGAKLDAEVDALGDANQFEDGLVKARRLLALREAGLPAGHWRIGVSKSDVGALALILDDDVRAEPLLRDAVRLLASGNPDSRYHANALGNLAALHRKRGEYPQAITLHERALAIHRKLTPDGTPVAVEQRVIAQLVGGSDHQRAELLLASALAIHDSHKDDRGAIVDMLTIATLRRQNGQPGAEDMYDKAIVRAQAALGPYDPLQARVLVSLATNHRRVAASAGSSQATAAVRALADAQFANAERVLLRIYGPRHTQLAELYSEWALNAEAGRDLDRAVVLRTKANDIEERHLAALLASGAEHVKRQYLRQLRQHTDDTLGLHKVWQPGPNHPGVIRLAITTLLRRKGRVLDAVSEDLATLRSIASPNEQRLLDELLAARGELAAATIRGAGPDDGAGYKDRLAGLEHRAATLESRVSERSAAFRAASAPVTLEAVQAVIPRDAALVEIVRYTPRDAKAYSAVSERWDARYVAYVVRRDGPVRATYMGDARTIDAVVRQFRASLSDPEDRKVGDPAWRLYVQTFARIRPLLGDAKRVLIAPDGALNIVPFGALMDEHGFLAETYTFSYLSSGRDLLRFAHPSAARAPSLIMADPVYAGEDQDRATGSRSGNLSDVEFSQLPGTAAEGRALAALLPGAVFLSDARATEAALKNVRGPELLHVATHGFFLGREPARAGQGDPDDAAIPQPLLRSGIALAGANRRRGGGEDDGILTALEATGLDLHGTKLVTLSACETALGDVEAGEGVFGLRRALVVAGAETQLLSLWKVDDDATRDLMIAYYRRLLAGEPRGEALRSVQLEMMRNPATSHPFYWASFIVSGNPEPLHATPRGAGAVATVQPGARGCGCNTTADGSGWLVVAVGLLLSRRRRHSS